MAQAGVRPHLDGSVALLLRQLQHTRMVGHSLVEVPLGVVGAAQVAVRSGLLAPVPQILRKAAASLNSLVLKLEEANNMGQSWNTMI